MKPGQMNVKEAAEALGVSVSTIRNWADQNSLTAIKLPSGIRRFRREDVLRMRDEMWQGFETREPLLGDDPVPVDAVSNMVDALNAVWPDAQAEEDHASMLHVLAEAALAAITGEGKD